MQNNNEFSENYLTFFRCWGILKAVVFKNLTDSDRGVKEIDLHAMCKDGELVWSSEIYDAFCVKAEDGSAKTVFRYQIPLPGTRESIFMMKHQIRTSQRLSFYESLLKCIQHSVDISHYLMTQKTPSVVYFSDVQQAQENGISYVYLETEEIRPIQFKELNGEVNGITLLDILVRLNIILRDVNQAGVCLRQFDIDEVFLNQDGKILLGGFYYARGPGGADGETNLSNYPPYLPDAPPHLTESLKKGGSGSWGQDVQMVALAAWNLFSGVPVDACWDRSRGVFPTYATPEIVEALQIGLSGKDENCNLFRRKLLECRKKLNQTEYAKLNIPVRVFRFKEYREFLVPPN